MKNIKEEELLFLEVLFQTGSVSKACAQLEIPVRKGYKIQAAHKDVILEMTNGELASLALQAVNTYRKAFQDDDGAIPKIEAKLKAADSVLDRVGASKRQVVEHSGEQVQPVVLMPAKSPVVDPVLQVDPEEN